MDSRGVRDMVDFDAAIQAPATVFARPADIVTAPGLTREQRIRLLRQWEWEALQLEVATEENMPGRNPDRTPLSEIREALKRVGATGEPGSAGTKYG